MSASPEVAEGSVPLADVEKEIARQLDGVKQPGEAPAQRARMSNLVVLTHSVEVAARVDDDAPVIVAIHPARLLLLIAEPGPDAVPTTAGVRVWCRGGKGYHVCSDQVTLHARGAGADALPFAVRRLLIGDLPTNLWWASTQPPALAGPLLYDLAENAQMIVYDSLGWADPHRGVAATGAWINKFERDGDGRWRVASDLNWRRLKYWRRLLGQALDPATAPGVLDSITDVVVEHGPHAVTQAWQLVGWLASRLNWRVQATRMQPGVEIAWQVGTPAGRTLRVRIHRAPEGPSEIHHVRFACTIGGKLGALNVVREGDTRLAAVPDGIDVQPRTLTVPHQDLAELVGRQLSDRDRDPVFRESMAVAQIFAQSVLG